MLRFFVFTSLAACGALAQTEQSFVDKLNKAYQSYDPKDDTSPAGVMITAFDGSVTEGWLADCKHCNGVYGIPLPSSNCKISTSILNAQNSHLQADWKAKQFFNKPYLPPFDCKKGGVCDLELGIYPLGPGWPLKSTGLFNQGGAIFGPAAEDAIKCAYPFDGASMVRPNRGCGCASLVAAVCPPNKNWHCPSTLNTCSNKDPLSPIWNPRPITENSTVITACQCKEMGITEADNPLWDDYYPMGLPKCMWQGPQFFEGKGRNELRQALRQQHNFRKHATFAWSEVILDGHAYNNLFEKRASETVLAFWYPRHPNCGRRCKSAMYHAQENFKKKYGVQVPVIAIDVNNGTAPFVVADQLAAGASDEDAPAEPHITMI